MNKVLKLVYKLIENLQIKHETENIFVKRFNNWLWSEDKIKSLEKKDILKSDYFQLLCTNSILREKESSFDLIKSLLIIQKDLKLMAIKKEYPTIDSNLLAHLFSLFDEKLEAVICVSWSIQERHGLFYLPCFVSPFLEKKSLFEMKIPISPFMKLDYFSQPRSLMFNEIIHEKWHIVHSLLKDAYTIEDNYFNSCYLADYCTSPFYQLFEGERIRLALYPPWSTSLKYYYRQDLL